MFFALGVGSGTLLRHAGAVTATGLSAAIEIGFPIFSSLDLVAEAGFASGLDYSIDSSMSQATSFAAASVRWYPFGSFVREARPVLWRSFYLEGGFGYADLYLKSSAATRRVAYGLAANVAVGWLPLRGRDWLTGIEVSGKPMMYRRDGLRNSIFVLWVTQLRWP